MTPNQVLELKSPRRLSLEQAWLSLFSRSFIGSHRLYTAFVVALSTTTRCRQFSVHLNDQLCRCQAARKEPHFRVLGAASDLVRDTASDGITLMLYFHLRLPCTGTSVCTRFPRVLPSWLSPYSNGDHGSAAQKARSWFMKRGLFPKMTCSLCYKLRKPRKV